MMKTDKNSVPKFAASVATALISFVLNSHNVYAEGAIEFNTDILDSSDRANIDLSQFSKKGFILPGKYLLNVVANKQVIPEQTIIFYVSEKDKDDSYACLSPEIVEKFGLTKEYAKKTTWIHQNECLDLASLPGITVQGDLSVPILNIGIPQAYLEYTSDNWVPPSQWENGLPGILLDYNLNTQIIRNHQSSGDNTTGSASAYGTAGANFSAWRLRADWQAQNLDDINKSDSDRGVTVNRYYAYRPISSIAAKLTLGEDYLTSDVFDSFRFAGASLNTEDSMLPPNLRGYAPEITGIARTNAKITVSQQGRILYETQVAAGPFKLRNLSDTVQGKLDVRVAETDGSVQTFQVNTADVPYLTRPGLVRYKMAVGRPSVREHEYIDLPFATGEFSWGISNGWSLYGGGVGSKDYQALSAGIGRDLLFLGAISFDATTSRAFLPDATEKNNLSGNSYRVSYSKRFDEYSSQVTFAGYRFSQRDYMSMSDYLNSRYGDSQEGSNKERYQITINKQFIDLGLSAYLSYEKETYWDKPSTDRFNLSLSKSFDIGRFKGINLSLTGFHERQRSNNDDGGYLNVSIPWGYGSTVGLNTSISGDQISNNASYYKTVDPHNSYRISAGATGSNATTDAFYNHLGDYAEIDANAAYQQNTSASLGLSIRGGSTLTAKGAALHRVNSFGGTRLLVDTSGVGGVPVMGNGASMETNAFGKAVITDVNSYARTDASIDVNNIKPDAEAVKSTVMTTLTEGAIGYRSFSVIAGEKAMSILRLADGSFPPFGAIVMNKSKQQTGIVADDGNVYLSGIVSGEQMTVQWNGKGECKITFPDLLPKQTDAEANLLLPCNPL